MKKIVSLATAIIVAAATVVPVFAASPTTTKVMVTPVTIPAEVIAAKGYVLTPEEMAAIATTPEQAVALSLAALIEGSGSGMVLSAATSPAMIAMAKADLLKNAYIRALLLQRGVFGNILAASTLARADGKAVKTGITINAPGLAPGQKVAVMYYLPGDLTPRLAYPAWKNGKLNVTLPTPCTYNLVS